MDQVGSGTPRGMDLERTLMGIERELTTDTGPSYRRRLTDDAIVIVPGAVLDKRSTVDAIARGPAWSSFDTRDVRLVELADGTALVSYTFSGHREPDTDYTAVLTSVYSREGDDWRMRFHQQTPVSHGDISEG